MNALADNLASGVPCSLLLDEALADLDTALAAEAFGGPAVSQ